MSDNRSPDYSRQTRNAPDERDDERDEPGSDDQNGFEEATYEDLDDAGDDEPLNIGDDDADDAEPVAPQPSVPRRAAPQVAPLVARSAAELLNAHVAPHQPKRTQAEPALLYRCFPLDAHGHRMKDEEVTLFGKRKESEIQQNLIETKPVLRGPWEVLCCQVGVDNKGRRRERVRNTTFVRTDVQISARTARAEHVDDDPDGSWPADDLPPMPMFDSPVAEEPMFGDEGGNGGSGEMTGMFRMMQNMQRENTQMMRFVLEQARPQQRGGVDLTSTLTTLRDVAPLVQPIIEAIRPKSESTAMMELFFKGMEARAKSEGPSWKEWMPLLAIALTGNPAMQPLFEVMAKRMAGVFDPGAPAPAPAPAAPAAPPSALPAPAPAGTPAPAAAPTQPQPAAPQPAPAQPQPQPAAAQPAPAKPPAAGQSETQYSPANARKWRQTMAWKAVNLMVGTGNGRVSRSSYWAERIFCEFDGQAVLDLLDVPAEDVANELLEVAPNVEKAILLQLPESERTDSEKAAKHVRASAIAWCADLLKQIRNYQTENESGSGEDAGDDD